jgi:hypothetical protein
MDKFLKNLHIFDYMLIGVILRSFIVGPTGSDAAVIIALVAAITYAKEYLNKKESKVY